MTTSLSCWQGGHPGWRHHCQGQRAAPGRLERAAGGCADRVGPAAGGSAWQRRPALQHRTRGGPVKAGPSPHPAHCQGPGAPWAVSLQSRCPSRDQDEGPGSVLSTASRLFPASRTGATGWLGLAGGPHLSRIMVSPPHPQMLRGAPHIPRSRRLSYSPQSPSSLPPSCLCTRP